MNVLEYIFAVVNVSVVVVAAAVAVVAVAVVVSIKIATKQVDAAALFTCQLNSRSSNKKI